MISTPLRHILWTILLLVPTTNHAFADETKPPAVPPPGYKLVWSDEFNYVGPPDPAKWTYEKGFVRNNEPQVYTDRLENAHVQDGHLIIEARKERVKNPSYDPQSKQPRRRQEFTDFTSASITTSGHASWTFGRFEVRAKLPNARGDWPAIWMLGESRNAEGHRDPWPLCGETDIMELWGARDPNIVQAHLIWQQTGKYKAEGGSLKIDSPATVWHVYTLNWFPDRMNFYVDDKMYQSIKTDTPGKVDGGAFQKPQYLLLNLALEPNHSKIDESNFPHQYIIDYVRVYQQEKRSDEIK